MRKTISRRQFLWLGTAAAVGAAITVKLGFRGRGAERGATFRAAPGDVYPGRIIALQPDRIKQQGRWAG